MLTRWLGWILDFIEGALQHYSVFVHSTISYTLPDDVLGSIYSKRQPVSGKDKHLLTDFELSIDRPSCHCSINDHWYDNGPSILSCC